MSATSNYVYKIHDAVSFHNDMEDARIVDWKVLTFIAVSAVIHIDVIKAAVTIDITWFLYIHIHILVTFVDVQLLSAVLVAGCHI